jgi:hypothetical protein
MSGRPGANLANVVVVVVVMMMGTRRWGGGDNDAAMAVAVIALVMGGSGVACSRLMGLSTHDHMDSRALSTPTRSNVYLRYMT